MDINEFDRNCLDRAVTLALDAEEAGNLPIGVVIALEEQIISEGKNSIWHPEKNLHKHAEMEALSRIPQDLINLPDRMTLYTTLEPCVMCFGAIMLYRIGRVVYGSKDDFGGASAVFDHLPVFFNRQFQKVVWIGPAYRQSCDPLYQRLTELEQIK